MTNNSYTTQFTTSKSPAEAFAAITKPRNWWSANITGDTASPDAVFFYRFRDVHRSTMHITEFVPGKKVVWHVLHNDFNFVRDRNEWTGTDIVFEIAAKDHGTEVRFTHAGLLPSEECYGVCADAWGTYIRGSLRNLIETGAGEPNPIEHIVNKAADMSAALAAH